jgi:hypothetical protein
LLHRLAFASPGIQLAAAGLEDRLFAGDVEGIEPAPPVFVTSLPRAGTTVLLQALAEVPGFCTHTYRDMPFVMAPLLWARVSGRFRQQAVARERAHGDGIEVSEDSPEAFEEVIWRAFWPEKYHRDRIALWSADDLDAEAQDFFLRHFRKLVALRGGGAAGRYVSKNNGNIARLALLPRMFPGSAIIVPVRAPLAQAASLLRQHRNFAERHAADPFAKRYMGDIGHYEFGALHRPFAFPGFMEMAGGRGPDELDYWLAYWIAAFEEVQRHRSHVVTVAHEALCERPALTLERLFADASLRPDISPERLASHFHPVRAMEDQPECDAALLARAQALYAALV